MNMTDLIFNGTLHLAGNLKLAASGGKVKVGSNEVLVVVGKDGINQGTGIPVKVPPPPGTPIDPGTEVRVIKSFNSDVTITVKSVDTPIVAMGNTIQGAKPNGPKWPGIVLQSTNNSNVTINQVPINVKGDSALTTANAGTAIFDQASGQ